MFEAVLAEIESHVAAAGWDQRPTLFALVRAARFAEDDPQAAQRLGLTGVPPDTLTPVEQEDLPDEPLDEVLAGIGWPDSVDGCVLTQEILVLPPAAQAEIEDEGAEDDMHRVATHPDRREARLVVGVLRDGTRAALLRLRRPAGGDTADSDDNGTGNDSGTDSATGDADLLTGADLAPNLSAALLATFD